MKNYIQKGYSNTPALTPDNFFGRYGATIYQATDDGFGAFMGSAMGVVFSGLALAASISGMLVSTGAAALFLLALSVLLTAIITFCIVTFGSTLYAAKAAKTIDYHNRYDYILSGRSITVNRALELSTASECFRKMSKDDKKRYAPAIKRMRSLVKEGDYDGAMLRVEKFNETRRIMEEAMPKFVDDSDLEALDGLIKGIEEIRQQRELTGRV